MAELLAGHFGDTFNCDLRFVAAFIRVVGSEFVQKYLGEGPRMVRDVFRLAKENAPAIIFIDEIDAIATKRFDAQTGGKYIFGIMFIYNTLRSCDSTQKCQSEQESAIYQNISEGKPKHVTLNQYQHCNSIWHDIWNCSLLLSLCFRLSVLLYRLKTLLL